MKLEEVLSGCMFETVTPPNPPLIKGGTEGGVDIDVSKIVYDSRKVACDALFVAVKGENFDGHDFIADAVGRGAAAIVYERNNLPQSPLNLRGHKSGVKRGETPVLWKDGDAPPDLSPIFIRVGDSRRALACMANNFYGRPSESISVIGVTGTNGKTTTSHIIKSILEAWGKEAGLIGTTGYYIGANRYPALFTTPEAPEFQSLLLEMSSCGCEYAVAEVSSHSLAQKRVACTRFVVVVFTNLTRDHLDFHGTMEEYYRAKKSLFTELLSEAGTAVINLDDEWGRRLLRNLGESTAGKGAAVITYGMGKDADVSAAGIEELLPGEPLTIEYKNRSYGINSSLLGIPNAYNVLAAVSVGIALGIPMSVIGEGVRHAVSVKGRFEAVDAGQDFLCIVDYAHSPDALERLIITARGLLNRAQVRGHEARRIITVFGCGGNRDRGKRAVMGEIATRLSDYVLITSDNPRGEDPSEIIRDVVSGSRGGNYLVIPDRREAITAAVEEAASGDIVLIAGKGHEDYQEIKGVRYRFSDADVAAEAIRKRLLLRDAGR